MLAYDNGIAESLAITWVDITPVRHTGRSGRGASLLLSTALAAVTTPLILALIGAAPS